MSVTEILHAVEKLSFSDRAKIAKALSLSGSKQADDSAKQRARFHQQLIDEGFLRAIPDKTLPAREFNRIKIKGKPLSETIIEERR